MIYTTKVMITTYQAQAALLEIFSKVMKGSTMFKVD